VISRIGKLLVETTGASQLASAQRLRATDVTLVLGDGCDLVLARSAVALTLRCFTGQTNAQGANGRLTQALAHGVQAEAAEYGSVDRLVLDGAGTGVSLGLGCSVGDTFVDPRGWFVSVNEASGRAGPVSAPAAAFAASAGVAKLFAAIIGRDSAVLRESWTAPMLDLAIDYPGASASLDLGRVMVIGAGAIGSGLAHVLRSAPWRAHVVLVDYDRYDEPNHETTLLVSKETTTRQAVKAAALAERLRSTSVSVEPVEAKVDQGHPLLGRPVEALVCAVDNPELRCLLDDTAARVVFNAGVGGTREDAGMVLWTRHKRGGLPLSAHYRRQVEPSGTEGGPTDVVTDECSRISYQQVSLAAPFVGLAAGALLAAGLVQEALGMEAPANYMKFDLLGLQQWPTRGSWHRRPAA
jgi:hypothetical protein